MALKKYILLHLIVWYLGFYSCSGQNQKMIFTPITVINTIDTTTYGGIPSIDKVSHYLVENYKETDQALKEIDAFVEKNKGHDYSDFNNYLILIFKKSGETNIDNITANKRIIDRYSHDHDLLFVYTWMKGKFICRYKYKDGLIVEPKSNIRVINLP